MSKLADRLKSFLRQRPRFNGRVYVAKSAVVLGDVTLGNLSSVWYQAVLRGDINRILVGHHTNIQDNAVLHLADDYPCQVGNYVTIGHSAVVHACVIGNETLIGMGAVILDGAVIGNQCLVGAQALVTPHTRIPDGSLVLGMPAKVARPLTDKEKAELRSSAEKYAEYAAYCLKHRINVSTPQQCRARIKAPRP
jgi:gamma-carbonic anhydrase